MTKEQKTEHALTAADTLKRLINLEAPYEVIESQLDVVKHFIQDW